MSEPTEPQYNNPEEQAFKEAGVLTQWALQAQFEKNPEHVQPDPEDDYGDSLTLLDPLSGAHWKLNRSDKEFVLSFDKQYFDDAGQITRSDFYYYEDGGLRRKERDFSGYDTATSLVGLPTAEDVEGLSDEEKLELIAPFLAQLMVNSFESFHLEGDVTDDIVEPAEQEALRKEIAATVPYVPGPTSTD